MFTRDAPVGVCRTASLYLDAFIKALYVTSNWVFIEVPETGDTGYVPKYCLRFPQPSNPLFESASHNNISLLNVSVCDKPRPARLSICANRSAPPSGEFISSIGPCHINSDPPMSNCSRSIRAKTFGRPRKDQSVLSRQISNMSLHAFDQDAYGTLNMTPCKSLSFSVLDTEPGAHRLRAIDSYQKRFVGDISVLESEVLTLVNAADSVTDWHFVRRGDGRQGYVPRHIVVVDQKLT